MRKLLLVPMLFVAACLETATGPVEGDLLSMKARWMAQSVEDYDITLKYDNEWVESRDAVVEVRGGVITSCVDVATGVEITAEPARCQHVIGLFDMIEDRASEGFEATLLFNAGRGFPQNVRLDHPAQADEAFSYQVVKFTAR